MDVELIRKYNVPGPRYTSYPTVPYWDGFPTVKKWKEEVNDCFNQTNSKEGISLYIHLPYCESLCTYCGCNTRITINHTVEKTYILSVLKEWELYMEVFGGKPRIKEIHLGGGTPTFFSPENLNILIQGILSVSTTVKEAEFSFEAHPNNTTAAHLQTLYDLGFRRMSLGIQDFDSQVQHIVNRVQSYETVEKVTQQARQIGFTSINFDLIYGLPLQKKYSVADTINKVMLLRPDRIAFYSYAHVPWVKPGQRKFTEKDLPKDEEKRELYETGRKMLEEAGYEEIGMDHFAHKKDPLYKASKNRALHRNFMGYTHSYTQLMIGLGVSSISDSWYSYAQNVKTVEEYYKLVNNGTLPIFRGHVLSEEDLILRKHILNIVCKFSTSWKNESGQCEAVYRSVERLKEMEKDGLVIIEPFHLQVTEKGKPFIRNICMAFDARLWKNVPKTGIFSRVI
ncbi:MAG: oxygen-independent coproporphyrinogen III oxidase [Bacteroidetes bacterium]|nr:MAG: oxygen-independent coproporphyrinogen III oxidase [Bacteroidota bacterium]